MSAHLAEGSRSNSDTRGSPHECAEEADYGQTHENGDSDSGVQKGDVCCASARQQ
ncbi:hypothetical protein [Streptomyces sp. NBC_00439]|uniref:hypothetical protein n=1 Tax=Streptomyces sp. NBC_00439 TaxID=2903650 RepID=UPI00225675C4|nr:hypothetical protein [Streptomyces sp. NBC_00439]